MNYKDVYLNLTFNFASETEYIGLFCLKFMKIYSCATIVTFKYFAELFEFIPKLVSTRT